MTPSPKPQSGERTQDPTPNALAAAEELAAELCLGPSAVRAVARCIDRKTGLPELLAALENAVSYARGAGIEPMWIAGARAALAKDRGGAEPARTASGAL